MRTILKYVITRVGDNYEIELVGSDRVDENERLSDICWRNQRFLEFQKRLIIPKQTKTLFKLEGKNCKSC